MPTSRPMQASGKLSDILEYYTDIDDLKTEMEEWRDNVPDSLQSSDKYSQVDEAAETLGNAASELEEACNGIKRLLERLTKGKGETNILDRIKKLSKGEVETDFLDTVIGYTEHRMYKGYNMPRWVRLANPCAALEAVVEFAEDRTEDISRDLGEEYSGELKSYIEQLESALGDLQNVEFPSMFG